MLTVKLGFFVFFFFPLPIRILLRHPLVSRKFWKDLQLH